ncbi:MAG: ATP-dependent helicase HrpB [Gemmatimonadota bacterium]|nr:ATP-dependent helicase HrpB [Gemmatimonadota bacterium]
MAIRPPVLPIDLALPELRRVLRSSTSAVLQAPPGAGKTTRVPLALLHEPWLTGRRIVMLAPRRLAARAAAHRMAQTFGEAVGGTVGYRVRHDTRVSAATRIEVVTEGILTRMLQSDPALEGVGLVVFDEFHERSIHADLGLALTLHSRTLLREDLRVMVMSATLDGAAIAALLGGVDIVTCEGHTYPVETRYVPRRPELPLEAAVVMAVRDAVATEPGDVLVFLPGMAEIRRVENALRGRVPAELIPLHGNLPHELQDRAIRASAPGHRKVVLATSIAETSLTIEGVRVVIDSGLARVPRYSPRIGMTRLVTVRVPRAAADQRRGRAGRVSPGICYRLWSAHEDHSLVPRATPEIVEADLAPLALELAAFGAEPAELAWLDPPPAAAFAEARLLLTQLGAFDGNFRITPHGRAMNRLSLHPRLAHMVLKGRELGVLDLACELAALLAERDVLRRGDGVAEADITSRLEVLRGTTERSDIDGEALRRAKREARSCRQAGSVARVPRGREAVPGPGVLLALAYPDRIGQRRPGGNGRFLLRNGSGAVLDPQGLAGEDYLVAADLDGRARESRILRGAALTFDDLTGHFADQIEREDVVEWDGGARAVVSRRRERLGAIVLREAPLRDPDLAAVTRVLLEGITREGLDQLTASAGFQRTRARLEFLRHLDPTWPDLSDEALLQTLPDWLGPHLEGIRRLDDVVRLDLGGFLLERLTWRQRAALDEIAPTHIQVPSGSRIPVDYSDAGAPVLAVRLQEVFGLRETPTVGGGSVPLTLHLLSPARRPVQVTRDLAGFWATTYFQVRRDLRGRYPKHSWPDDPLTAEPTRQAKSRR